MGDSREPPKKPWERGPPGSRPQGSGVPLIGGPANPLENRAFGTGETSGLNSSPQTGLPAKPWERNSGSTGSGPLVPVSTSSNPARSWERRSNIGGASSYDRSISTRSPGSIQPYGSSYQGSGLGRDSYGGGYGSGSMGWGGSNYRSPYGGGGGGGYGMYGGGTYGSGTYGSSSSSYGGMYGSGSSYGHMGAYGAGGGMGMGGMGYGQGYGQMGEYGEMTPYGQLGPGGPGPGHGEVGAFRRVADNTQHLLHGAQYTLHSVGRMYHIMEDNFAAIHAFFASLMRLCYRVAYMHQEFMGAFTMVRTFVAALAFLRLAGARVKKILSFVFAGALFRWVLKLLRISRSHSHSHAPRPSDSALMLAPAAAISKQSFEDVAKACGF